MMEFPLDLKFKILAFVPQVYLSNSRGDELFYIYQRYWKIKEKIIIYNNRQKDEELFQINADRIIDFSPRLDITDNTGRLIVSLKRSGWRSLIKGYWEIIINDAVQYQIIEENPIVKFLDKIVSEVPIVGIFSGFFLNPRYAIIDQAGQAIARIIKKPSFLESHFTIENLRDFSDDEKTLAAFSGIVIALFERRRG